MCGVQVTPGACLEGLGYYVWSAGDARCVPYWGVSGIIWGVRVTSGTYLGVGCLMYYVGVQVVSGTMCGVQVTPGTCLGGLGYYVGSAGGLGYYVGSAGDARCVPRGSRVLLVMSASGDVVMVDNDDVGQW
ncbi:hypothetical protein NDU88_007956 [Pleurodeles waltl]|uniref:Bulb-type lectin domain-containing protein n=1 Tax=Pleurodeles waltl TaxID=8319 RepID=A0AAV7U2R5_PLEWA|nr:hypothetical protein NDU88_007956 [Pleurodeles waltl]